MSIQVRSHLGLVFLENLLLISKGLGSHWLQWMELETWNSNSSKNFLALNLSGVLWESACFLYRHLNLIFLISHIILFFPIFINYALGLQFYSFIKGVCFLILIYEWLGIQKLINSDILKSEVCFLPLLFINTLFCSSSLTSLVYLGDHFISVHTDLHHSF